MGTLLGHTISKRAIPSLTHRQPRLTRRTRLAPGLLLVIEKCRVRDDKNIKGQAVWLALASSPQEMRESR